MNIKTFAQQSRSILLKGVRNKLFFWGFSSTAETIDEPLAVPGGYLFRGEAYDDPAVPARWRSLKNAIKLKGLDAVIEEAAYTWFNRLMAIRILAKNGYDIPQLEYTEGQQNVPSILHRARRGTVPFLNNEEKHRLQNIISDFSKEQQAFGILITGYCHSHQLLQRVFGSLDDYTELLLPDDILSPAGFLHLLNTTDAISEEEYRKVELIGWLYQFYISEKKDEVFKKFKQNKKAEAADIPAATQIFTPNWIVKYMVENTVGKIWLDLHPQSPIRERMKYLVENAAQCNNPEATERSRSAEVSRSEVAERRLLSEVEVSRSAELPFPETNPTRRPELVEGNSQPPTAKSAVAERSRSALISEISHLKLLDPASGSGHILVEGFDLLFEMYLEEYYSDAEAVESILKNNLFGLDIDKRAAQLAQFAILLKAAARYPEVLKTDWQPQVYAMPDATDFSTREIMDFLGNDGALWLEQLQQALQLLNQSQNLGSIIKFDLEAEARQYIADRWSFLQQKQRAFHEEIVFQRLKPFIPILCILTDQYEAIAANPPYMGQKNMNALLKDYVNINYPLSKSDLFAVFIQLMIERLASRARMGCITMESWMFLSSYEKLREKLLKNYSIVGLAHFGWHIIGIAFGTATLILENSRLVKFGEYSYLTIDDIERIKNIPLVFPKKDNDRYAYIPQSNFSKIPGSPISYWASQININQLESFVKIGAVEDCKKGADTGNNDMFLRFWNEVSSKRTDFPNKWIFYNKGGSFRRWYGNFEYVINWENDGEELKNSTANLRSKHHYFKDSLTWNALSSGSFSIRFSDKKTIFDSAGSSLFLNSSKNTLFFYLGLLNSKLIQHYLLILNPTFNYGAGTISNLPLKSVKNPHIETKVINNILISKNDWNSREISWDFVKSPLFNDSKTLSTAYHLRQQHANEDFFNLHTNEEELNQIFIDIYGLQDELTPEVALKDITILKDELDFKKLEKLEPKFRRLGKEGIELPIKKDEVMRQLISYAIGVFMGRYRLDKPGLNIAHPNPTPAELQPYTHNRQLIEIDEDAIIPLMGNNASFSDDALHRLKHFLVACWGTETLVENINFMQSCLDDDIENYLLKDFWKDHVKRYKKKPIYWLFSSPKGAFQVLVYMHRMNAFTVDKIRGNYLMEHLKFLRNKIQRMESGNNLSTLDARQLEKLRLDLDECERYDLLLKTIADKQISFDLDDGVTTNYQLFEGVVAEIK